MVCQGSLPDRIAHLSGYALETAVVAGSQVNSGYAMSLANSFRLRAIM